MAWYNPLDWAGSVAGAAGSALGGGLFGIGAGNPSKYDAEKYLTQGTQNAQNTYNVAMTGARQAAIGPQYLNVRAPSLQGPGPDFTSRDVTSGQISAQDVNASDLVAGQPGMDLRAQTLAQIERARTAPSAAAGQMRAGLAQTTSAALGQAGMARGADRAAARRDALLATAAGGMTASGQTAALAAQEQAAREGAAMAGLANVRAGDVQAGQLDLSAQAANQAARLQAQQATQGMALQAGMANQGANLQAQNLQAQRGLAYDQLMSGQDLAAQQANQNAAMNAYIAREQAKQGYLNQATGAQNAYTGATSVAANYATGQNQASAQKQAAGMGMLGAGLGMLSDVNVKKDVGTFADRYGSKLTSDFGMKPASDPYAGIDPFDRGGPLANYGARQELMSMPFDTTSHTNEARQAAGATMAPQAQQQQQQSGNLIGGLGTMGLGLLALSDEEAKQAVQSMDEEDRIDWAHKVEPITFRYKDGVTEEDDGGAHAGVSAQQLEQTGPLGKLMVHRDPYTGMRKVDGLALGLMMAKAALDQGDRTEALIAKKKGGR